MRVSFALANQEASMHPVLPAHCQQRKNYHPEPNFESGVE
jgi:hypothetical protein